MPALNIMVIQLMVLNSGRSSSRPSPIRPNRLQARTTERTTKAVLARTKNHDTWVLRGQWIGAHRVVADLG
jgi:hypothetical protein